MKVTGIAAMQVKFIREVWLEVLSMSVMQRACIPLAFFFLCWAPLSLLFWQAKNFAKENGLVQVHELSDLQAAKEIWRVVVLVSNQLWWKPTCLQRCMAQIWLMKLWQIPGRIRIGVDVLDGRLDAHAWVEVAGVALDGTSEQVKADSVIY